MGVNPPPGKFPAAVERIESEEPGQAVVAFKCAAKDAEYLLAQVGQSGILEWTPASVTSALAANDHGS